MPGVKGRSGGHNRKTTAEKMKLGVQHRKRLNKDAPDTVQGPLMTWDDHLGEHGKAIREYFLPMLVNNGTLGTTDSIALHRFCRVAEDWFKYDKMCLEKGRMVPVKDKQGVVIGTARATWSKLERELSDGLGVCLRELGLGPLHRDAIKKICHGEKVNRWALKP